MISGIWNLLKEALAETLAREARRMSFAEGAMRPFTPLERLFPTVSEGCGGLAA